MKSMDPTQSDNQNTTTDSNTTTTPSPVADNIQKRFDEMTADKHEMRRQLEATNLAYQDVLGKLAAVAIQNNTPPPPAAPPIPEGIDPALFNALSQTMQQAVGNQLTQFKNEIGQMMGGVRQSQEQLEFQQEANQYPVEVQKEASKLMANWKKQGLQGWRPVDALLYAEGQLARNARLANGRNRPNGDGGDSTVTGAGLAPATTQRTLPPPKSDAELSRMSPAQQEAYWSGRVGDSELVY